MTKHQEPTREEVLAEQLAAVLLQNHKAEVENQQLSETVYALRCELRECRALIGKYMDRTFTRRTA